MAKIFERPSLSLAALFVLAAYLFFFQLGGMALTDPDETFYAQTAKEMLERGEWSTPYLYDKPQFEKPIFFYWLVRLSFQTFGVNEFAARLPSAVFAFLGLVAIYLLGSILFNKRVGFLSAAILASNVEYIILSRACVTDMTLLTLMLFGVLFFAYGYLRDKKYFYLLSAASLALATLTKGPIAVLIFGAVIVLYILIARDLRFLKKMPIFGMAATFLIVALPWYLLMYKLHGKSFLDVFFGFHNITRFLEAEHKIGSQVYYNIPIVLGGFFPWSIFLPVGFWNIFKKTQIEKRHAIFILLWFFVIFTFFSISSTKLPTYIFPCFISLALIVAVFWDDFLKRTATRSLVKGMKVSYYSLVAVVVIGIAAALIYINIDYPSISKGIFISSAFLLFGILLSLVGFVNKKFVWTFFLIVYAVALFLYPLNKLVLPQIELYETSKEVSRKLSTLIKGDEKLGSESNYLGGLAFYTGRIPTDLDKHHILIQFINSDNRIWCILKDKNYRGLYDPKVNTDYVKPCYMVYRLGKRSVLTNEMPRDGKYILKRERPDEKV